MLVAALVHSRLYYANIVLVGLSAYPQRPLRQWRIIRKANKAEAFNNVEFSVAWYTQIANFKRSDIEELEKIQKGL